ncbi:MAG TPA: hypothetical protein VHI54_09310 [Actinomycetota bacterium]|nr:hypothetical protein [Actinomycetota bacterium]
MAIIARRLLSVKLTLVLSTTLLAGLLVHVSLSAADVTPCDTPTTPPTFSGPASAATTSTPDHACGVVDAEGGSVQTDPPATEDNPHWTKVTIPPGFPGTVDILETEEFVGGDVAIAQVPAPGCDPSAGRYTCLSVDITTTQTTTRKKPMLFRFTFDKSTVPAGKRLSRIRVYHFPNPQSEPVRVPRCDDEDSAKIGYELEQGQQSCHAKTTRLANRDIRILVLSTINGRWKAR